MNQISEHASGVVYWYGVNSPSLILTDRLNVCHERDRERHNYSSSPAGDCYTLVSRYEWGPESNQGNPRWGADPYPAGSVVYFPAQEDEARTMTGTAEFTVRVLRDNHGILVRRKFDYAYPNPLNGANPATGYTPGSYRISGDLRIRIYRAEANRRQVTFILDCRQISCSSG